VQPVVQLAAAVSAASWSSLISVLLLLAFEMLQQRLRVLKWPRLAEIICLRVSEKQERAGIDHSYVGDIPVRAFWLVKKH
jgi:ammonia channel protein AmtB